MELIRAEDSPHTTMQRIAAFQCHLGALPGVIVCCDTAQVKANNKIIIIIRNSYA